jgi:hypothetical protein
MVAKKRYSLSAVLTLGFVSDVALLPIPARDFSITATHHAAEWQHQPSSHPSKLAVGVPALTKAHHHLLCRASIQGLPCNSSAAKSLIVNLHHNTFRPRAKDAVQRDAVHRIYGGFSSLEDDLSSIEHLSSSMPARGARRAGAVGPVLQRPTHAQVLALIALLVQKYLLRY